jgi:peptidoglycan hydrolase-like protein with peptidoglycan-binding domain
MGAALPVLVGLGLLALASSSNGKRRADVELPVVGPDAEKRRKKQKAKDVEREKKRIVNESKDIIHGKRNSYSKGADDANAIAAAREAQRIADADAAKRKNKRKADADAAAAAKRKADADAAAAAAKPQPPEGYDRVKASNTAPDVAKHLRNKGRGGYSRAVVKAWQTKAGIRSDGIYGRETYAALKFFAGNAAPKPFFAQGVEVYPWEDA